MESQNDPLIGLTLGNFKITAVLGQGAMGAVYAAQHVSLPARAAVKVLLAEFARDQTSVDRFLREAHTASSINDPHIVRIFDAGRLPDGRPYLLMDLLEGRTLDEVLLEGPLDLRRALEILRQIASAVAVVHEHGILHRDLKPSNVHLGRSRGVEVAKILDFGLARSHGLDHGVTTAGTILGTPLYMSPEQAAARPVGPESDVYALGCIAHEALSGEPPFLGDSVVTVMHKHLTEPASELRVIRPGLPPPLSDIVTRCLDKHASRRPTAKEVVAALEGVQKELERSGTAGTIQGLPVSASLAATQLAQSSPGAPVQGSAAGLPASPAASGTRAPADSAAAAPLATSGALEPKRRSALVPILGVVGITVAVLAGFAFLRPRDAALAPVASAMNASPPVASSAGAGPEISEEKNPFAVTDTAAVEAGRAIWVARCAQCHGVRGDGMGSDIPKGSRPKAFCDVVLPPGTLDVYYFGIIRHGVERGDRVAMPSFEKKLGLKETWQVVSYINTLRPKVHKVDVDHELAVGAPPSTEEVKATGDALFYTRCSTCHGEEGKGDGAAASLFPVPPPDLKDDAWNPRTLVAGDDDLSHVFRIMTTGSGEYMGSFSSIPTADRWAIARHVIGLRPGAATKKKGSKK